MECGGLQGLNHDIALHAGSLAETASKGPSARIDRRAPKRQVIAGEETEMPYYSSSHPDELTFGGVEKGYAEHMHDDCAADQDARLIRCPDCGQLEWWSEAELIDHGRCRAGAYPCVCDDEE